VVSRPKLISLAIVQAIATGAFSLAMTPAMAQQADGSAPQADTNLGRVEITGSNIRRADAETPSPVQVLKAEDLKKSGLTTVAQVLQNLTSNGQGSVSNASPWSWTPGGSGISLHGAGVAATLVLIDGHRMAAYPLFDAGQNAMVDISNIPFDAIERIEILKDGASAIYGSDAMAGVVNVILKKSFVGTTISAEAGTTTEGGGTTAHATFSHGFGDLANDGYNAYFNLEYRHQDQILQSQRQGKGLWSIYNWSQYGGLNETRGANSPNSGSPPQSAYLFNPSSTDPLGATNTYFYPGTSCSSWAQYSSNGCSYLSPTAQYQPETQNINVLASINKKLGDDWVLNTKASLFASKGDQNAGDLLSFPQSLNQVISSGPGQIPTLGGTIIPQITVPANYPGNPFGVPAEVYGLIPGSPSIHTLTDSKAWRLVSNLTGSIGEWDIDTSLGYARINTDRVLAEGMNVPALEAALNRTTNPFNVNGSNTAADLAAIFPETSVVDSSTIEFAEFHASRSLAHLPGGDLGFSTGGEILHSAVNSPAPSLVASGAIGGNQSYFVGSQTNSSVYAELAAPVIKQLEIDGSLRYDHFNTSAGNAVTPKLGFKWKPQNEFAMRGTVATGFRAPNIAESGNSGGVTYQVNNVADPKLCPNGLQSNGLASQGAVVANGVNTCNFGPVYMLTSNPALKPEKSVSDTLGVILEPIKGWSTTIDLYQVRINNQIIRGPSNIDAAVRGSALPTTCADGNGGVVSCTPQYGPILYVPVEFINANSTRVSGLELESRYNWKLGDLGSLAADVTWTHEMSYILTTGGQSYQLAGTHGPENASNDTGNPKDRIQAVFTWDKGPLQVATTFNWTGSFNLTDPSQGLNNCASATSSGGQGIFPSSPPPADLCSVRHFLDTDLTVRYRLDKHWTVHGNVNNLFNQQPPVDLGTFGGGWTMYNASFHQAGAVGRFVNVGANYSF